MLLVRKIIDQDETFNLQAVFELLEDASIILVHTEDVLRVAGSTL